MTAFFYFRFHFYFQGIRILIIRDNIDVMVFSDSRRGEFRSPPFESALKIYSQSLMSLCILLHEYAIQRITIFFCLLFDTKQFV